LDARGTKISRMELKSSQQLITLLLGIVSIPSLSLRQSLAHFEPIGMLLLNTCWISS
jgi:hypothetical protein